MAMRDQSFWAMPIRFRFRRVGGLRFIALGAITVSWSISRNA